MIPTKSILTVAASFAVAVALQAAPAAPEAPVAPAVAPAAAPAEVAPAAPEKCSPEALQTLGWFLSKQVARLNVGLSDEEANQIMVGFRKGLADDPEPAKMEERMREAQGYLMGKIEAYSKKQIAKGEARGAAFLADLAKRPAVKTAVSGLVYEVLAPGEGAKPTDKDMVSFTYARKTLDGKVLDSASDKAEAIEIPLAQLQDQMPGLYEGFQLVAKGGKAVLYVKPDLGYRNDPQAPVPLGEPYVFEYELLDIKPAPVEPSMEGGAEGQEDMTRMIEEAIRKQMEAEAAGATPAAPAAPETPAIPVAPAVPAAPEAPVAPVAPAAPAAK